MDKIINPLDGEMDLLGDTKSDIVRKLNPLNGRLEVVYKANSYIQKINPFIGDFDMVGGTGASYIIKEVSGNGYINLTNAVANHLMELKAYGGIEQSGTPTPTTPVNIVCNNGVLKARHQSGLPLGYTLLDSVTNAGGGYLDTGIMADVDDMEFDVIAKINSASAMSWYILQSRASSGSFIYGISGSATSNTFIGAFSGTNISAGATLVRQSGHTYHVNSKCKNGTITLTVEDLTDSTSITNTGTYTFVAGRTNIGLFGNIVGGGTIIDGNTSVISAYIKKSGVKVLDCVSASQGTTAGFYDKVSGTFKTATAGNFVAGTTVNDPVEIYIDGTTETIEDELGNTATAEMLLKVGDYVDEQEILSGDITRKVGIMVLDGTENWTYVENSTNYGNFFNTSIVSVSRVASIPICNYFSGVAATYAYTHPSVPNKLWIEDNNRLRINTPENITTVTQFKQWLADQYNTGTPVIVVYPLATPTTESVTGQTLNIPAGDSDIDITQASIDNLGLYAKYKATA